MTPAILLQYVLPHRLLSRLVYWATRWTWRPWKNFLIRQIVTRFQVDLSEAQTAQLDDFAHFNAFFTRHLKPGARSPAAAADALLCPADGKVSQAGPIEQGRIFQAKGQSYTAAELLASQADALPYENGSFATIYLSPRDYHRAHMPLGGTLVRTVHVPGRLFSVAPDPVAAIPRLFARNERLICHFESETGPFVVVMVGALLVSSVSTVWSGLVIPPYASRVSPREWREAAVRLERFAEMAWFNMGSTVIVLLPPAVGRIDPALSAGQAVKVGERIGTISPAP